MPCNMTATTLLRSAMTKVGTTYYGGDVPSGGGGDESIITFADHTKLITATATGGGDGSDGNPWTREEGRLNAAAGDIVGVQGIHVGSNPGGTLSYTPAFNPANSGTLENPIVFVGDTGAEFRSGATVSGSGWPAFGALTRDHIHYINIRSDNNDANNKSAVDSAPCSMWSGEGFKVIGCELIGESGLSDNYSGIRFENAVNPQAYENTINGFTGGTNKAGVIVYKSQNPLIRNNTISNCTHGVQIKGATTGSDIYGLDIYKNLIHDCDHAFRLHGPVKGPSNELSLIYQNICYNLVYGFEFTSSATHTGEQDGLRVFNNTFNNLSDGLFWLNHNYDEAGVVPRDNTFFNNIVLTANSVIRATYAGASTIDHHDDFGTWDRNLYSGITQFGDGTGGSALETLTLAAWQATYGQDTNSISSNPLFTDAANHDFTLQGGSPALTTGRDNLGTFGTVDAVIPAGAYVVGDEVIGVSA